MLKRSSGISKSERLIRNESSLKSWFSLFIIFFIVAPLGIFVAVPMSITWVFWYFIYLKCMKLLGLIDHELKTEVNQDSATKKTSFSEEDIKEEKVVSKSKKDENTKFDVVVYGATGFTGKFCSKYLTEKYGMKGEFKWAIAGRSLERLKILKSELTEIKNEMKDLEIIIVDSSDQDSIEEMCKKTKVVIACVGPFEEYGTPLVYACAKQGTDYVDITGEFTWVAKVAKMYAEQAKKSGARIVNQCGWDSVPYEQLTYECSKKLNKNYNQSLERIDIYNEFVGELSGGTFLTARNGFDKKLRSMAFGVNKDKRSKKNSVSPPYYNLPSESDQIKVLNVQTNQESPLFPWYDRKIESWTGFFVMSSINFAAINRLNNHIGMASNKSLSYSDKMLHKNFKAIVKTYIGYIWFLCAIMCKPLGYLMSTYFIRPGQGPSESMREKSYGNLWAVSKGNQGAEVCNIFTCNTDPGYVITGKIVSEAALCFIFNRNELNTCGGFYTPISQFKECLVDRIRGIDGVELRSFEQNSSDQTNSKKNF